jgi:hypothetical protein
MRRFLATFWTIGVEHEWAEQNINTEVKQKMWSFLSEQLEDTLEAQPLESEWTTLFAYVYALRVLM